MSVSKRLAAPTIVRVLALASLALVLASTALSPRAAAQGGWGPGTVHDHRTQPIVRDHRARLCRVGYDAYPDVPGNPYTITTCYLPDKNTQTVGSFCTCSVLIQGHYTTVGGSIVLASAPNG